MPVSTYTFIRFYLAYPVYRVAWILGCDMLLDMESEKRKTETQAREVTD